MICLQVQARASIPSQITAFGVVGLLLPSSAPSGRPDTDARRKIQVVANTGVGPDRRAAGRRAGCSGLVRQISGQLQRGDIALADRFFCNYWVIADSLHR